MYKDLDKMAAKQKNIFRSKIKTYDVRRKVIQTLLIKYTDDAFDATERTTLPEELEGAGSGGIEDAASEGPAGGGDGGADDAAPVEIPVADEGLDSEQDDAEQESAVEDAVQEDETEATIVVTEVATEASVVEELEVATTDESVDTDGNTKLLIALALISVISSGTYLFLRKKYN